MHAHRMPVLLLLLSLSGLQKTDAAPGLRATSQPTLRLVHVLFRHGNRNPEEGSCWAGNQYLDEKYYPEGFGQLTNAGKRTEYHLGLFLRESYDEFLGEEWNINYLDVRSTDYNRTKMSALLVLSSLWPPLRTKLINRDLPWQPIPYNYATASEETILTAGVVLSNATFQQELASVLSNSTISDYLAARYGWAMEILSTYTGIEVTDYFSATSYSDCMKIQLELGYSLPEWALQIYPYPLTNLVTDIYYMISNTTAMRQMTAGPLIRKILLDSLNMAAGTLSPSSRKMFIYSAHDINVGTLLRSLDFEMTQPPPYGATVIIELHEKDLVYGLEVYYEDYTQRYPHAVTIPGCAFFCPLTDFANLVADILPA